MIRPAFLLPSVTVLALPGAALAQETRSGAQITATGGYSSSPFAEARGRGSGATASLSVAPYVAVDTERNTLKLSGVVRLQAYSNRYPLTDSYRVSLDDRLRASERLALFGHVDLSTQVLGGDDPDVLGAAGVIPPIGDPALTGNGSGGGATTGAGTGAAGPGATGVAPVVPIPTDGTLFNDIGLLGSRDRRRSVYVTGGGQYALSQRDSFDFSGFVDLARYSRFGSLSNYNGYGETLGYSRRVSSTLRAGAQASVSRFDYRGARGRTNIVSAEGTLSGQVNQFWTFAASLGVSIIDGSSVFTRHSTSISGSLQLCRQGERDVLCALASRQARATGFNGAQFITTADLNWRHRLNERSSLSADAVYVEQGGLTTLNGSQNKYLRTAVTLDRDITERLRGLVSARYRQVFGGNNGRVNDYGGQIGLSYRLGAQR